MCGLYGFLNYSGEKMKNLSDLTNSLSEQSAVRGTDATGIAFCNSSGINILKESKSAYRVDFKHSDDISSLTGHTRHSTQGSEKHNYNNHPFSGKCKNSKFALSHNGVLSNDRTLRKELNLPKTKIETDSYIAVQLIESQKNLDFESIKYMAEKTEGSFSYSILDDENNIWLVKGDSPISILHFPKLKMYVYASTDEILYKALIDYSPLFAALKKGEFEEVKIDEGEILKIRVNGTLEKKTFEYSHHYGRGWWEYDFFSKGKSDNKKSNVDNEYLEALKDVAVRFLNRKGLKHIRFHDLRHTSCTLLLSEGISMKTLQKRLGHSDYRTTADIYSHVLSSDEMIASCIADDIVFSKMG